MRFSIFLSIILGTFPLGAVEWTLNGGTGSRLDDGVLEIIGTGSGSNAWTRPVSLEPGTLHRFKMEACSPTGTGGGGNAPCGLEGVSRDRGDITKDWKPFSYVFRVPDNRANNRLRVGQWESAHTYRFRNVETVPVEAVPTGVPSAVDGNDFLQLGDGEMTVDDTYRFRGEYGGEGSNFHRSLIRQTTGFNSYRFTFGGESEVVYRFELKPIRIGKNPNENLDKPKPIAFLSATVSVGVCYHVKGNCLVDVSKNGTDWTELGKIDGAKLLSEKLSESLFPADAVFVRIRSEKGASFQVDSVNFEAALEPGRGFRGTGETVYADVRPNAVAGPTSMPLFFDVSRNLYVLLGNTVDVKPMASPLILPGRTLEYAFPFNHYRDARFGYAVADGIWWAEPDWKVAPTLPQPPKETKKPIAIGAAKNDFESFQLVVNGSENGINDLSLSLDGNLYGKDGATISADNVQIRYAYYHFVHRKTDKIGLIGDWPDALPPLEKPLVLAPKRNQPLWVTVKVPQDAKAGDYRGTLKLRRNGAEEKIPFSVHVWNFALPERNRHETAFGMNHSLIFRYHNCKTDEEKRAVLELYWKNFADYRVSVYTPAPLDPVNVTWNPDSLTATLDFTAFDKEIERRIREHKITNFRMGLQGMGWRTYENRSHGKIGKFEAGSPQYEAMLSDYLKKIEAHLKEKGRLDMAYIYWFDEPEAKDYEFVAEYNARLQKYAPGLARMITEEPNAPFLAALEKAETNINIWCPVSHNYNDEEAQKRQANGERFWWYVCTGPKAPYCTLFIDHPGTELRVWFWQAFQRKIVGSLVWTSTYWTSPSAFPKDAQNPYDDPMGYVSSGPPGSKRYWGNGDGRFVYPPLEAATPGRNDGKAILKPPVASIRWEMIREGIEDHEMLLMLLDLKTKRPNLAGKIDELLIVPAEITSSMTEFTKDPKPIYERRRAVARLLER